MNALTHESALAGVITGQSIATPAAHGTAAGFPTPFDLRLKVLQDYAPKAPEMVARFAAFLMGDADATPATLRTAGLALSRAAGLAANTADEECRHAQRIAEALCRAARQRRNFA